MCIRDRHYGLLIMIAAVIIMWILMDKSKFGRELKITGSNENFAKYAGIKIGGVVILSLIHILEGDISNIHFKTPGFDEDARKLRFTEKQASAILEMRLYKLIGLEILALEKEYKETLRKIKEYEKILSSKLTMDDVIKKDLEEIKTEFATPRRTLIEDGKEAVYDETAVEIREVVFVMDKFGYGKLVDRATYDRNQELSLIHI